VFNKNGFEGGRLYMDKQIKQALKSFVAFKNDVEAIYRQLLNGDYSEDVWDIVVNLRNDVLSLERDFEELNHFNFG
jgi:hypothetical protein